MSKELATIKTDIELDIPNTQITDTIFKSESVLQDSQEQVSELELNKYIRQYKTQHAFYLSYSTIRFLSLLNGRMQLTVLN